MVSKTPDTEGKGGVLIHVFEEGSHSSSSSEESTVGAPDIAALHFRQAQFTALDHANEFFYRCFSFGHKILESSY